MRRATFAGLALGLTMLIVSATTLAFAAASPHDPGVTVVDGSGHRLGADPTVPIGARLTLRVAGFAAQASITVRTGERLERRVVADRRGVATVSVVAVRRGAHTVIVFGEPRLRSLPSGGVLRATVPRVARFSYHVSTAGVAGTDAHRQPSRLAGTGLDVVGLLGAGLLAVVTGALLCVAGGHRFSRRTG